MFLGKPATLSSIYPNPEGGLYTADHAVDGIHSPPADHERLSIAHTKEEDKPWLRVNLEESYCIWAVRVLNRKSKLFIDTYHVPIK